MTFNESLNHLGNLYHTCARQRLARLGLDIHRSPESGSYALIITFPYCWQLRGEYRQ